MFCPSCGSSNDDNFQFCMKCGQKLTNLSGVKHAAEPFVAGVPVEKPMEMPIRQMNQYNQQYVEGTPYSPYAESSEPSMLNIWGPFAGYGNRRRHVGWLMDGCGDRRKDLLDNIIGKFREREIPNARITQQTLKARGIVVETRPYFIFRRQLVTMGLNISSFGRDLFISIVSYLKPPISNFRIAVLALMLFIWLFSSFALPAILRSSINNMMEGLLGGLMGGGGSSGASTGLFVLLCLIGPITMISNLALLIFILFSSYKWITVKDFWAGLRTASNEFNEDDLMALEKSIEQTVRISLDEIGLNSNDLKPINPGDSGRII